MINDRYTARVLGALLVILAILIDVSSFIFVKPEVRQKPGFALIVILPSLPIVAFGIHLLRRASKLREEED